MVWNEPGKKNEDPVKDREKDPWSGRNKQEGPPDLDEALRKLQAKFSKFLGVRKNKNSNTFKLSPTGSVFGLGLFLIIIIAIWFLMGFFIVHPSERGLILHFGKYDKEVGPGLHWVPRFFASYVKVNVQRLYSYTYPPNEDTELLTKDENLVSMAVTVQYRINNPTNFLFNVDNPLESLHQATASAMRQAVGLNTLDDILTTGREQIRDEVKKQLTDILDPYQSGIQVVSLAITSARVPDEVREAFDDAIKAREDGQRYVNQAEAYAYKVKPIARGHAQRILETAKAYKQQVQLQAEADTASFLALLPLYQQAPGAAREQLYLTSLENVLKNTNKVLIDTQNGNNIFYIPLDKLMQQKQLLNISQQIGSTQPLSQSDAEPTPKSAITRPTRSKNIKEYDKGESY